MLYMVTFTINIPPMLAYIPYMDPMGMETSEKVKFHDTSMWCFARSSGWYGVIIG